ncbi:pyridine nucleotide-disulfide oxidoreductase domain-containing protein 2-like [Trifolium pratense]|uniref:Pyridine nucleotide-disulfide oxidoreductase domain-containing protein 2-like n=1 Tax=Trifolium pratense TaxID=57577 RepID=A0A2K3PEZ4_TRIPR|nr:pyridine nucleotide-disulfide oxidoreductase domain-containing protein 2-like [Trifolium pratense]
MGAVSLAICKAAKEAGVHIETDTEVLKVTVEDSGRANGVLLADGTEVHSSVVLSNATPYKTFMELVPQDFLPVEFLCAIKHSDYSSQGTTKINVAVDKLPQFHCLKTNHAEVGPQHTATVHIGFESMENIISACQDACNGIPSQRPVMEMTIPSSLDNTISPPGKHVISLFTQYTPYKPSNGSWDNAAYRESFAQRCFNLIEEYAPGFCSSVIGYDMLTPPDLEREIGLTVIEKNQTIPNPNVSAVTLRSGKERAVKSKKMDQIVKEREILDVFKKDEVNIPLLEAIKQIPRYAKFLKEMCTNKRKLKGNSRVNMSRNVYAIIQQTGLPEKCEDPGQMCVGGNIFHGAMGLDSLFLMRPIKGWSNHKTPIQDLYLCGSGSHPGGGVMGAPGRNAACVVLQEFKNRYQ